MSISRLGNPEYYSQAPIPTMEAAILFAAGYQDAAVQLLRGEIERPSAVLGVKSWIMLFDVYRAIRDSAAFTDLGSRYRATFGAAPPRFDDIDAAGSAELVRLEGTLARHEDLAPLLKQACAGSMVGADMLAVQRIEFGFANAFCTLLRGYTVQGKHVFLANIRELHAQLLEAIGGIPRVVILRREKAPARATGAHRARPAPAIALH